MELFKEAQNIVDFATYYPILNKATADNDSPTPGYLYDEILKMSYQSLAHRTHLIDFLLVKLQSSSCAGRRKVIRVFLKLTEKGHWSARMYMRQKDSEFRIAASKGGPPDPLLGNTPQLFLNSDIQELLGALFDPKLMRQDEEEAAAASRGQMSTSSNMLSSMVSSGYGCSNSGGKYEGFGNTANTQKKDNIVSQVKGLVERAVTGNDNSSDLTSDLLKNDRGDYQPVSLPNLGIIPSLMVSSRVSNFGMSGPPALLYSSIMQTSNVKEHVAGRAGGGWESDEELDQLQHDIRDSCSINSGLLSDLPPISKGEPEELFLDGCLTALNSWPVNYDELMSKTRQSSNFDSSVLLGKMTARLQSLVPDKVIVEGERKLPAISFQDSVVILLLIEYGLHYDIFSPILVRSMLSDCLSDVQNNKSIEHVIRIKSKKISMILEQLTNNHGNEILVS